MGICSKIKRKKITKKMKKLSIISMLLLLVIACKEYKQVISSPENKTLKEEVVQEETANAELTQNKGIGPIKSITLASEIDQELVTKGEEIHKLMCAACHKTDKRYIGPAPAGIMERRSPEWIMNMILNPDQMVKEDSIAKKLLAEYRAPMANQNLTEEQARAILEYFRTL